MRSRLHSSIGLWATAFCSSRNHTKRTVMSLSKSRLVYGKDDVLFGAIETAQDDRPFGTMLDAGTGMHSLRWIATLKEAKGLHSFTAITADENMQRNVQREAEALGVDQWGSVILGNWFGEKYPLKLPEKCFDTILLDYLIGAMDGFSPYEQDQIMGKVARYLKPGGRLYVVGLQPIPDSAPGDANLICRMRQVRDACILLAGHRCYREYPVSWIERQIERTQALQLSGSGSKEFPILYRHQTIVKQLNVARSKLSLFPNKELATSMGKVLDDLEAESLQATARAQGGVIRFGFDYLTIAIREDDTASR